MALLTLSLSDVISYEERGMIKPLRKVGNSNALILDKPIMELLGLEEDGQVQLIPILIDNCGCGIDGVTVGRGLKSPLEGLSAKGPAQAGPFFAVPIDRRCTINLPIWYYTETTAWVNWHRAKHHFVQQLSQWVTDGYEGGFSGSNPITGDTSGKFFWAWGGGLGFKYTLDWTLTVTGNCTTYQSFSTY